MHPNRASPLKLRSLSKWYLLSIVVLIPAMIMWIEYTTQTCPRLQSVCAGVWLIFAWLLIASLPSCLLITKVTAHWLKSTQLLHVNHFFYLVRLHEDIAYIMWTVVLFCFWRYAILTASDVIPSSETQAVTHVLGCLVAWSVLVLLKNYAVLEIAHQNLWRPYVDRIQSSLFAQYTFLLLTDFVLCGYVSEKDEEVALEFSKSNRSWQNMSIYAVMRTMSWVPKTRLQDLLTDGNGTKGGIVSKDSARGFALRLFDRLLLELEGVRVLQENGTNHRKGSGFVGVTPPQEGASVSVSPFREVQRGMVAPIRAATRTLASGLSHGAPPTTEDQEATMSPFSSVPRGAPRDQLTLWSFRPIISRPLALEIMRILDANSDESISRDEFARAFVRIYRERRSLTRSMKDYELVINKLGHIFALFMYLILLIICCLIFRLNVAQLAVTSIGLFVGFSFMFGSTATNLMESCIFIFITRAYDVGDRISFVENGEKLNCVVQQINLLSTIFINWDDQWFSVPNQAMARKQIYNQRRSLMARSKLDITVDAKTPAHVISDIESRMRQWAENTKNLTIIPSSIEFLHRNLQNPYVLGIVIVYAQTNSFQDNSQRFRNQDGFTREASSFIFFVIVGTLRQQSPCSFIDSIRFLTPTFLSFRFKAYVGLQGCWGHLGDASADSAPSAAGGRSEVQYQQLMLLR
jgi:small-conductance mechanosensitive channel